MPSINWYLIVAIGLLVGTVAIILLIPRLARTGQLKDTSPILINPVTSSAQVNCTSIRTPCDPKDPNSCARSCTEEELICVNLDSITPTPDGQKINGGGSVCLPNYPDIQCNTDLGGVYVWTGWGFEGAQNWDCYCSYPEYFGGIGCAKPNPDVCTGGQLDLSKMQGQAPNSSICNCPTGTTLLMRSGANTPYCESTTASGGGGFLGLAGQVHASPDWRNVIFRPVSPQGGRVQGVSLDQWAKNVVIELTSHDDPNLDSLVTTVLSGPDKACQTCTAIAPTGCTDICVGGQLARLNQDIASQICGVISDSSCQNICASDKSAIWDEAIQSAGNKAWYTYSSGDWIPEGKC